MKLMEDIDREKAEAVAREAEAAEKAKASARAAISSLIPSKLFGNKEKEEESPAASENAAEATSVSAVQAEKEVSLGEITSTSTNSAGMGLDEEVVQGGNMTEAEVRSDGASEQVTA